MAKTKETSKPQSQAKEIRKRVAEKIDQALPELKNTLGEKKFKKRLKQVVKILSEDVKNLSPLKKLPAKVKAVQVKPADITPSANGESHAVQEPHPHS